MNSLLRITVILLLLPILPLYTVPQLLGDRPIFAQSTPSLKLTADQLRQQGDEAVDRKQYEVALSLFQRALSLHQSISDHHGAGLALNSIGAVYYYDMKDMKTGKDYFIKALGIARQFLIPEVEIKALTNLGHIERNYGNTQRAIALHQQSLELAQKTSNCYLEVLSYENLGYDVLQSAGPLVTNRYLEQGVSALNKCKNPDAKTLRKHQKKKIDLLNTIALNYFTKKSGVIIKPEDSSTPTPPRKVKSCTLPPMLKKSVEVYQQAANLAQQINEPNQLAEALSGIGKVYGFQNCFQESANALQQARQVLQRSPDTAFLLGKTLIQLSIAYRTAPEQEKDLDKALEASQSALKVFRGKANSPDQQLEYRKYEAQSLSDIGAIYVELADDQTMAPPKGQRSYPEKALDSYEESIQISKSALVFADTLLKPEAKVNNSWIYIQKNVLQILLQNACAQIAYIYYVRLGQRGERTSACQTEPKP